MADKTAVERVEEFLRRVDDLDVTIDARAGTLFFVETSHDAYLRDKSLADVLHYLTNNYHKAASIESKKYWIEHLEYWIDKAYMHGVIKQGDGVLRKLCECTEENNRLRKAVEEVSQENLQHIKENAELRGMYTECQKLHGIYARKDT